MLVRVEAGRAGMRKMAEEGLAPELTADNIGQDIRLFDVEHHHRAGTPYAMRKRRPGLLVRRFAVYHHHVAPLPTFSLRLPAFPAIGPVVVQVDGANPRPGLRSW